MNIEESDTHCHYHRNCHYSDQKTGNKKEGTAEFTEYGNHQCHIAAEAENIRIDIDKITEIHHLFESVTEEKDTEKKSENKNQ